MVAIGLMSGTSRDGIDAALIRTDGEGQVERIAFHSTPYGDGFRTRLAEACMRAMTMEEPDFEPLIDAVETELTQAHVEAVADLMNRAGWQAQDVDVIGRRPAQRGRGGGRAGRAAAPRLSSRAGGGPA